MEKSVVAMVTTYYAENCGKKQFQIQFSTHVGLEVYMSMTHFWTDAECALPWLKAYYAKHCGEKHFQIEFGTHGGLEV